MARSEQFTTMSYRLYDNDAQRFREQAKNAGMSAAALSQALAAGMLDGSIKVPRPSGLDDVYESG